MSPVSRLVILAALVSGACGTPPAARARANVVLYVDTDAPVPKLASRLRVDFFKTDGTWFESRDLGVGSPSSWPVSFGVYLPPDAPTSAVLVRLRVYPLGKLRDYRGYRYEARPIGTSPTTIEPGPAPTDGPTLLDAGGNDVSPPTEPEPLLTIDRLVLVPLEQGTVGAVHVTMAGACFGTMADMRDFGSLQTCTDTEGELQPVAPEAVTVDAGPPGPSQQGAFEQAYVQPCAGSPRPPSPLLDDDVCVTGGAFVFGSKDESIGDASDDQPERVALVPSFYMDRYEVTVGRMRAAAAHGFSTSALLTNDAPLDPSFGDSNVTMCAWSTTPMGRETYPVACIDWNTARAFCQKQGGDLPLEVQWEYAAAMSGRAGKTHYPWGDGTEGFPSCTDVVFARGSMLGITDYCADQGKGPTAVTLGDHPGGDRSVGLGLVDLGGEVAEWALDTYASLRSDCWLATPLEVPSCTAAGSSHTTRGGSWVLGGDQVVIASRIDDDMAATGIGFRCVRPGGP